jgi:hypothetical protein
LHIFRQNTPESDLLPENFSEVMLFMYLFLNKAFLFSSQGKFPVLKKAMLFLPAILPPVMAFYDPAGVFPLLFSFLLLIPSSIPSMS